MTTTMKNTGLKRICVYCGSTTGRNPLYAEAANRLGSAIAAAGLGLVYGGGTSGLMGIIAQAAINKGGHVTGIMPTALVDIENAFYGISEYHEVNDYHERKMLMFKSSDAFIALPGGPGTLEEIIEQLAWAELGHHQKPIFIVNINGYWNRLLDLLKQMDKESILNFHHKAKYIVVDEPEEAVEMFLNM
jgi:uncharacterized protein (TIGR00730 family)